jgi:hypothetical protein
MNRLMVINHLNKLLCYIKKLFLEQNNANIQEFKRLLKDCAIALKQSQKTCEAD